MNPATRRTEGNATAPVLYMGLELSDFETCVRRRRHAPAGEGVCGRPAQARRASGEGEGTLRDAELGPVGERLRSGLSDYST